MPPTATWWAVKDAYSRLGEMGMFTVLPVDAMLKLSLEM